MNQKAGRDCKKRKELMRKNRDYFFFSLYLDA